MDRHPENPGRTFANDDALPRVPLPTLEASCERFLEWCAPLLTPEELEETAAAVHAFADPGSGAHTLQAALEKYDARDDVHSWLDEFWPRRYLGRRDRIALNANFFFLFPPTGLDQCERAASLVMAALHYKHLLDEELVPPAVQRGQPLSMTQNRFLFSTTRIPGLVQDEVRAPYTDAWPGPSRARHIVVLFRGSLFRLEVIGAAGRPHSLDELAAGLRAVMAAGASPAAPGTSVGHLTTQARATWARNREALLACAPGNAAVIDDVETALFCVCLEDLVPATELEAADQLLHGDSGNRWFDKAISFIVFADGTAGVNVEHCELDGTTVLGFVDSVLSSSGGEHADGAGAQAQGQPPLSPLRVELDDRLRAEVRAAAEAFAAQAADTATMTMSFSEFGSDTAKRLGVSPDAFVQIAYQLAHQRARGFVGATYESIATRQYRRGRTEAMRVVTPEIVRFVTAMADPDADTATRREAFAAAAMAHVTRAKACQAGEVPEQHLWELQLIGERHGEELGVTEPFALHSSPGWSKLRDDYLSTSSAPSATIRYFGFGSTSSHCIGVGYVLQPDHLNLYLSAARSVADDLSRFTQELGRALPELVELLRTGT